ncbi:hypothetical protein PMAYCL1PPCAC_15938, partial [Pristionchus mayeri]
PFQETAWSKMYDESYQELRSQMSIIADGCNFKYCSLFSSFINYNKNHFQISVKLESFGQNAPAFIQVAN